jgi:hypothetical protein
MFNDEMFEQALATPRLRQPLPKFVGDNRAERVAVIDEDGLRENTAQWFAEAEHKVAYYAAKGLDIAWIIEWAKKYWWSWQARDMSLNSELYAPTLRYKDPSTFGRVMVGLDEFIAYNFAYFAAIPDWRYDPIPGQLYIDLTPEGETRVVVRYYGSGHWDGPLRLHPYDDTAPAIPGSGAFVQCTAIDRYHFNTDHLMYEGETLFDGFDAAQSAGLLPGPRSWRFRTIMRAASAGTAITRARRRVHPA